jgi:hypothetical protein
VSITGATLALFTSSEEDGKIGINATSGSIKLDIVDAEDSTSLVGDALDFVTKDGSQEILFEPGMTVHTQGFRIKNNGNIPINYIVYLSKDDTTQNFIEAFDFWITDDPTDRDAMTKLYEFDGRLEREQSSDVYYLVLHMKETADNDYQDQEFTGVGITVLAVQGNVNIEDVGKR